MSAYTDWADVDPFAAPTPSPKPKVRRRRSSQAPAPTVADVSLTHTILVPRDVLLDHALAHNGVMVREQDRPGLRPVSLETLTTVITGYALRWWDTPVHEATPGHVITGSGQSVADRLGWARQPDLLRTHLLDWVDEGTGLLTPWMTLAATDEDDDGLPVHPGVDGHWTVHVRPVDTRPIDEGGEGFVRVPLWWLLAPRHDPLDAHARQRRGLLRCTCGTWLTDRRPWRRDDIALLGALMVIESADWDTMTAEASVTYLASRWGRSESGVEDALSAARRRGYVTAEGAGGRKGKDGAGIPALRAVVTSPAVAGSRKGAAVLGCPTCVKRSTKPARHLQ